MWLFALMALASSASAGQNRLTLGGESFGPQRTLTCTWFSNFENSRFDRCEDASGKQVLGSDGASIRCVPAICEELDASARKAAGWTKSEPPWGTFRVELLGRISVKPHLKRYIGDGTRTVFIERLVSVRSSASQP